MRKAIVYLLALVMILALSVPMISLGQTEDITSTNEPLSARWAYDFPEIGGMVLAEDATYVDIIFTLSNNVGAQNSLDLVINLSHLADAGLISIPANPIISEETPFGINYSIENVTGSGGGIIGWQEDNLLRITVNGANTSLGQTPVALYATLIIRFYVTEDFASGDRMRISFNRPANEDDPRVVHNFVDISRHRDGLHFEADDYIIAHDATYVDVEINLVNTVNHTQMSNLTMIFMDLVNDGYLIIPDNPVSNFVGGNIQIDPADLMGFSNNLAFGFILFPGPGILPDGNNLAATFTFRLYVTEQLLPGQSLTIRLSRPSFTGLPLHITSFTITRAQNNNITNVNVDFNAAENGNINPSGTAANLSVPQGTQITAAQTIPTPTANNGFIFSHWSSNQHTENIPDATAIRNLTINANTTFTAHFVPAATNFTVTFNGNNGTPATQTRVVAAGETVGTNMPTASRANHNFAGWFNTSAPTGGTEFTGATAVSANITVYARWTPVAIPDPTPEFIKNPDRMVVNPGETINWTLRGFHNRSGGTVSDFTVVDIPGVGLNFRSASIPAFTNGEGITYEVRYTVAGSNEWRTYRTDIDASRPFSFSLPQPGNLHYTNIALFFGNVPADFALGNEIVMTFTVGNNAPNNTLINRFVVRYDNTEREGNSPNNPTVTPPTESGAGGSSGGSAGNDGDSPKTGDDRNIFLWALLAVVSAAGMIALAINRKTPKSAHQAK